MAIVGVIVGNAVFPDGDPLGCAGWKDEPEIVGVSVGREVFPDGDPSVGE